MKKIILAAAVAMLFFSACKEKSTSQNEVEVKEEIKLPDYPQELNAVFEKHGGIRNWKNMKSLGFEIVKPNGNEKQTIDLVSRNDLIETEKYTIGFDGNDSWILQDSAYYKGNARFYHNLMFYFYAMPFVLGDDGISYEKTEDLVFEDVNYPGYKISYNDNIGDSPDDNYFIYYNKSDNTMAWLGYTVTYGKGEASNNVSYIRYNDWKLINGLLLPNAISWFQSKDGKLMEPRNTLIFENIKLSDERPNSELFKKPEGAEIAKK